MNAPAPPKQSTLTEIQLFLGSWNLAIPLMFILGLLSIVGSLVPQGSISQTQASERIPEALKPLVIGLQFNDVYRSPVFMIPLLIFFVSLACVTGDKVIPRLFGYFSPKRFDFGAKVLRRLDPVIPLPAGLSEAGLKAALQKAGYRVRFEDGSRSFFEKHGFGRFAALVTHIGLFTLVIAAVVSALTTTSGQFSLQTGQSRPMGEVLQEADTRARLALGQPDWNIRFSGLQLEPGADESFSQSRSKLEILSAQGQPAAQGEVSPAHPFSYGGIAFYQLDWGLGGLEVQIGQQKHKLSLRHIPQMNASITPFQAVGGAKVTFFVDPGGDVYLFDGERQPMGTSLSAGQTITLENTPVTLEALDARTHMVRLKLGTGSALDLDLRKVPQMENMQLYVTPFQMIGGKKFTFVYTESQPSQLLVFDERFQPVVLPVREGDTRLINGEPVTLKQKLMFSQFHYRIDKGFPLLLLGLALGLTGLALAGFSHKEIWLAELDGQRCLVGRSSKLKLAFYQDLKRIFAGLDVPPGELENLASPPLADKELEAQPS